MLTHVSQHQKMIHHHARSTQKSYKILSLKFSKWIWILLLNTRTRIQLLNLQKHCKCNQSHYADIYSNVCTLKRDTYECQVCKECMHCKLHHFLEYKSVFTLLGLFQVVSNKIKSLLKQTHQQITYKWRAKGGILRQINSLQKVLQDLLARILCKHTWFSPKIWNLMRL
jgi:hypothetical protein